MSAVLSIVVPTYQRRGALTRVLTALAAQSVKPSEYEVVVSVDGSTDGTLEMLTALTPPYRLLTIDHANTGRAGACNRGIAAASGDIVVLLDDDMEPQPPCLAAHLAAHAAGERLAVLGAVPIPADASSPRVVRHIAAKFNRHLGRLEQGAEPITFRDFYSGHLSIRRALVHEVGGFDEAFREYGNEDGELAVRLFRAGVRVVYEPRAVAIQHYEKTFATLARDTIGKGRTAVLCAGKHPETFARLKLGSDAATPLRRRLVRAGLLGLTRVSPRVPDTVVRLVAVCERVWPARLDACYSVALDYFYWLGARSAPQSPAHRRLGR